MIVCRICLAKNIHKDTVQLQHDLQEQIKNKTNFHTDVMLFCLNIHVTNDSKASKLCLKCYKKVIAFSKFKLLALENDKYFHSLENYEECHIFLQNKDVKEETKAGHTQDNLNWDIKEEIDGFIDIKQEFQVLEDNIESDDELLITIKQQKDIIMDIKEDSKENLSHNAPLKKKRGRKKQEGNTEKLKICEECGKAVHQLKEHMEVHKSKSERKVIKCKSCDKKFSTYTARWRHNRNKHLGFKETCSICSKSVSHLKAHMQLNHSPDALKYPCLSCDRKFTSPAKLEIHSRIHTKDRPFQCDFCQSTFRTNGSLYMHVRSVHEKEKSHLCQYCSKSFFKKYHLQLHIRTHTKEKPHKCEECGKHFSTTNTLKIHRKRHAGIKNVLCKFCDMSFICKSALSSHMVTHTKEKRHACQYCGIKFYRSDHRLKHERTAHLKHMHLESAG